MARRAREADTALDAAWSGLLDVLAGWSKVPGIPEAAVAASLRAALFPDGLKFTQIAFKLEWAESNTRILLIKGKELETQFKKLGAMKLVDRLYELHREYGQVLGITSPAEVTGADATGVGDAFNDLVDALRTFVVRVSAMISKKDAKSSEIARQLLAPVERWRSPPARARSAEPDDAPTEPAPPVAPIAPIAPTPPVEPSSP